jgi:Fe-S oxidoreductase
MSRSCYGREESMGTAYDTDASDYVDEMAVRHETARVFDVCVSCQQCVTACSVFPLMLSHVHNCVEQDAALLTPTQQDDIIDGCIQCTQCTTQCPYVNEPAGRAVNFPALAVRHRAMLRRNNFLTVREELSAEILSRSATHTSWIRPFRFFGARLLRYVTGYMPTLLSRRSDEVEGSSIHRVLEGATSEVTFFPTCVIDAYAPEVDEATQKVFATAGVRCVRAKGHNCCGAPDLYAGNIRRFRRVVAKNVRGFRHHLEQGRHIVVGQPGCLHVMREHYADFTNSPDVGDVVAQLQDPWEFLAENVTSEREKAFRPSTSHRSLVLLQSSMTSRKNGTSDAHDLLMRWGWDVQVMPHIYIAETMWELRRDRVDVVADSVRPLMSLTDAVGDAQIVGQSCLTNYLLTEQGHRSVRHPLEVLAEQIK